MRSGADGGSVHRHEGGSPCGSDNSNQISELASRQPRNNSPSLLRQIAGGEANGGGGVDDSHLLCLKAEGAHKEDVPST